MERNLIIISGPTCSGKNALVDEILDAYGEKFEETVSFTTREPRKHEEHGSHYHFVTKEEFQNKIKNDEFLEWAVVHDIYFGTDKKEIERIFSISKTPILILDVQGALNIKKKHPKTVTIFIMPENEEILEKRIRGRGHHDEEDIERRFESAKKEMEISKEYDHIIVNKEGFLKEAVNDILNIINK